MNIHLLPTGERVTQPGPLQDFAGYAFDAVHTLQRTVRERDQQIAELEQELEREVHMRDLEIQDLRREVDEAEARCDALARRG